MADEPENHALRLLREIRDEQASFRTEVAGAIGEFRGEFATMRADQGRMLGVLEELAEGQNHGARFNAIVEGRLAIIERQTGLVKA